MKKFIKSCIEDFKKVPSWLVAMSLITTLLMNILANKTLYSDSSFMSVDCGTTVSWVMFLVMDIVTQRYGGKSSFAVTIFDVVVTLFMSGIMCLVAIVPESSVSGWFQGEEGAQALNNLIGNNYLVVLTSLFAFVCASLVDIVSNITFGKWLNKTRVFKGQNNKRTVKNNKLLNDSRQIREAKLNIQDPYNRSEHQEKLVPKPEPIGFVKFED